MADEQAPNDSQLTSVPSVAAGDPIRAAHYNAVRSRLEEIQPISGDGIQVDMGSGGATISRTGVLERTRPGVILKAWSQAGVLAPRETAVIAGRYTTADEDTPTLWIVQPDADTEADTPFVVALDKIGHGEVGRVWVSGVTLAYVWGEELGEGESAPVKAGPSNEGEPGALKLCSDGTAEVLWREDAADITDPHMALIRFPAGSGGRGILVAPSKADLPELSEAAIGYAESENRFYRREPDPDSDDDGWAWYEMPVVETNAGGQLPELERPAIGYKGAQLWLRKEDAVGGAWEWVLLPLDPGTPVKLAGTAVDKGDGVQFALATHQHGIAASAAELLMVGEGSFGYYNGKGYMLGEEGRICITHTSPMGA